MRSNHYFNGVSGFVAILLWMVVFLFGLTVNSAYYRESIPVKLGTPGPNQQVTAINDFLGDLVNMNVSQSGETAKQRFENCREEIIRLLSDEREALAATEGNDNKGTLFSVLFMAFLSYTLTNVAVLCCFAGIVGTASRNYRIVRRLARRKRDRELLREELETRKEKTEIVEDEEDEEENDLVNPVYVGVIRGFLVYVLVLAGVYASTNSPFENTTAEQYGRMAGTVSLLAFLISYDSNFLESFMGMAKLRFRGGRSK